MGEERGMAGSSGPFSSDGGQEAVGPSGILNQPVDA